MTNFILPSFNRFKNKILLSLMVLVVLMSGFGIQKASADLISDCSDREYPVCSGVYFSKNDHQKTSYIKAKRGDTIYFQFRNKGTHGIGFGIIRVGEGLVSSAKYAAPDGDNYGYYQVEADGSYYLRGVCGGEGQTGCGGFGFLRIEN